MYPLVELQECTSLIKRGISPKYADGGVLVINQRCVRDGRLSLEVARRNDADLRRVPEDRYLHQWDVLVNSTGVGTLGRVAQLVEPPSEPMTVDSHVTIVRPNLDVVDGRFFGFACRSRQPQIEAMGEGATGQTELSRHRLGAEVELPFPPLSVQRKIAAVLAAYDELIENNLRRIEILEDMAQAVYREWFVNFRYPGHENVPLVDSPLGAIPEGWEAARFGTSAVEVKEGVEPSALLEDERYVGLEHIPRESFTLTDFGSIADVKSRKWRFEAGDVLFGRLRPYFHKVALAPFDGACSTDAIVIRPEAGFEELVLQVAFSKEFVAHAVATSGGTDRPRAKWRDLANFPIVLPPRQLRQAFSDAVRPIVNLTQVLARQNANLRSTRDLLLPKLVSGEIDVSDLDIDTDWLVA